MWHGRRRLSEARMWFTIDACHIGAAHKHDNKPRFHRRDEGRRRRAKTPPPPICWLPRWSSCFEPRVAVRGGGARANVPVLGKKTALCLPSWRKKRHKPPPFDVPISNWIPSPHPDKQTHVEAPLGEERGKVLPRPDCHVGKHAAANNGVDARADGGQRDRERQRERQGVQRALERLGVDPQPAAAARPRRRRRPRRRARQVRVRGARGAAGAGGAARAGRRRAKERRRGGRARGGELLRVRRRERRQRRLAGAAAAARRARAAAASGAAGGRGRARRDGGDGGAAGRLFLGRLEAGLLLDADARAVWVGYCVFLSFGSEMVRFVFVCVLCL